MVLKFSVSGGVGAYSSDLMTDEHLLISQQLIELLALKQLLALAV